MASFPTEIVDPNEQDESNDIVGNKSINNAADYNRHDREIIAIEEEMGISSTTDLSTLRGRAGSATRAMIGTDNSMISRDSGLSSSSSDTVDVAPTRMFIGGIFQENTSTETITGVDSNGFYIFYAKRSFTSTSVKPKFTFKRKTSLGDPFNPTDSEIKAVIDAIEADASTGAVCLLGEALRVGGGPTYVFTDYALDGIYESGFISSFGTFPGGSTGLGSTSLSAGLKLVVEHNLGSLPRQVTILYSGTSDGADAVPVFWSYDGFSHKGAAALDLDRRRFSLQTAAGGLASVPLSGTAFSTGISSGFYNVIASRDRTQFFSPS